MSAIPGVVDIDDYAAEKCSGGFTYTLNLYSGTDGTGEIVKSISIDERPGYDLHDESISDDPTFGLLAESFSIVPPSDAPLDGDGYRVSATTSNTFQSSTVSPNEAFNFSDLNGLGIQEITVNKVNTSFRS